MRADVPMRHLARCIVEPSQEALQTVQLENVESSTGRLIGTLVVTEPAGQNRFRPGDVLFSKLRPYLAKSLLVAEDLQGSGEFLCLRPSSGLDSSYLVYLTLSRPWLEHAVMTSYGTKMPRSSWEQMSALRVPHHPLDEQRRIADFLDDRVARIDQIIDARHQQQSLLTSLFQSRLDVLVDGASTRWGTVPLRRHLRRIEQGWSPQVESSPAVHGEPAILKLGAVRNGEFRTTENKAFRPETSPPEQYRVRDGDLLMTRANTPSLVGDVAVARISEVDNLYLSDLIYRLSLDEYDVDFASLALRSTRTRQHIGVTARGTSSSMPKLRGEDIAALRVPRVPLTDQQELACHEMEVRAQLRTSALQLNGSIDLLTEYKTSLITAAVTGELDVTTVSRRIPGE